MENLKFHPPVILSTAEGSQRNIEDVQAGTDFLLRSWPGRRGEKHREALQACSDASAGKKPAATARRAFAAAARDAGVLIKR